MNKINIGADSGGKEAIERLVAAYGFRSRQALCDQLGVSKSTMANRYLRNSFPADWVIQCSLETGASLLWLSTGQGEMFPEGKNEQRKISDMVAPTISRQQLKDGKLFAETGIVLDNAYVPPGLNAPLMIDIADEAYLIESAPADIKDGQWLIEVEGLCSIKKITRIPVGKIRVSDDDVSFDCSIDDIKLIGRVCLNIKKS